MQLFKLHNLPHIFVVPNLVTASLTSAHIRGCCFSAVTKQTYLVGFLGKLIFISAFQIDLLILQTENRSVRFDTFLTHESLVAVKLCRL